MFKGFNFKLSDQEKDILITNYYNAGLSIYNDTKNDVEEGLDKYINPNGRLNCTKLQEAWFPTSREYHIFLSHSHADEKLAISFAGYLYEKFKLNTFIDSCVWSYCNILLKKIDDRHCKIDGQDSYWYESRNQSTAHVHMMLSTALQKMIDSTECIIFLNTNNSIIQEQSTQSLIKEKTGSAWIYLELIATKCLRSIKPNRTIKYLKKFSTNQIINEVAELKTEYDIGLEHLIILKYEDFQKIYRSGVNNPLLALNALYYAKVPEDTTYNSMEVING